MHVHLSATIIGVMIQVPPSVEIPEGEVRQVCAEIFTDRQVIVEREVRLTLTIPPGKCPYYSLALLSLQVEYERMAKYFIYAISY